MKRSIFAYIIALSIAYLSSLGNVYANDDKGSIIESLLAAESGGDCHATYSVYLDPNYFTKLVNKTKMLL